MIPGTDVVRRVIVVTEDVLGPMRNSLYIELIDGNYVSLDDENEMRMFVANLGNERPELAASIGAALGSVGEICGEQVFDLE
jgi:hypothetical protein